MAYLALPGEAVSAPAYAPWAGPTPGMELKRRLIAWARLAPSAHNSQPWLCYVDEADVIVQLADPRRVLPASDPTLRQFTLSQGAFLELLTLAAAAEGVEAVEELFPEGPYGDDPATLLHHPVAYLTLRPSSDLLPPSIFIHLPNRRTSRAPFTGRAVSEAERQALLTAARTHGVAAGWLDRGVAMERVRALTIEGIRTEMNDPAALEELAGLMRLTRPQVAQFRDGLVPLPFWLGTLLDLLFGPQAFARPGGLLVTQGIKQQSAGPESAAAFLWMVTPGNSREEQLAAGRAYLRLDLEAARLGLGLQPLSQALERHGALAPLNDALQALLAPEGGTVQMLCRIGTPPKRPDPTPRRAVEALIT